MIHTGTYDFAPSAAVIDSDDRVFATVRAFDRDRAQRAREAVVAWSWAIATGAALGAMSWYGLVMA